MRREVAVNRSEIATQEEKQKEIQMTFTLLLTVISFVVCWTPLSIFIVLDVLFNVNIDSKWTALAGIFYFLNSICDPIIFICRLETIREAFKKMCGCCRCCFI
jgi:Na+/pantothenate symporter